MPEPSASRRKDEHVQNPMTPQELKYGSVVWVEDSGQALKVQYRMSWRLVDRWSRGR